LIRFTGKRSVKTRTGSAAHRSGTGYGKVRNAEYRCGMAIGLRSRVRVRVMAMAWVMVRFRVVFCSNIAQFLTLLRVCIAQMRNVYGR